MSIESPSTYYEVLQLARDATPEEVRVAYRKLARRYHPDRSPGDAEAARTMAAVNAAYAVLADGHRRAEHDLWIRRMERTSAAPRPAGAWWTHLHPASHWPRYLMGGGALLLLVLSGVPKADPILQAAPAVLRPSCQLGAEAVSTSCQRPASLAAAPLASVR